MEDRGLRKKTVSGVVWNFLELSGRQGVSILVTVALARFLAPEDFGLIAMVSVFFSLANAIMDGGLNQGVIRRKDAGRDDLDTLFYANGALSLLAYILLFLSAPSIAAYFGQPVLSRLVRISGTVVIINSFRIVQATDLTRRLDFKLQFKASVPAGILSGAAAVLLAAAGAGVWSLVAQMILSSLFTVLFYWRLNSWRPSLSFSWGIFRELFGFGWKFLLSWLLEIFFRNIYILVIGRLFSSTLAGYYFFAMKIRDMILSQVTASIQKATYPALASISGEDGRLKDAYRKIVQATVYLVFPAMVLLAALARPLFGLFLNPRWIPAAGYLQILCAVAIVYPLNVINLNILKVKGRSGLFLGLEIFKKGLAVLVLVLSVRYGIPGLLLGQVLTSFLSYIPNSFFSVRLIQYPVSEQVRDVLPALAAALLSGGTVLAAGFLLPWGSRGVLFILFQGAIGCVSYLAFSTILGVESQKIFFSLLRERLFRREHGGHGE